MPWSSTLSTKSEPPALAPGTGEQNDLTNILEYSRKLEEKGGFPKLGADEDRGDVIHEEPPQEKVEVFQDLVELGSMDHPEPSIQAADLATSAPDFPVSPDPSATEVPFNLNFESDLPADSGFELPPDSISLAPSEQDPEPARTDSLPQKGPEWQEPEPEVPQPAEQEPELPAQPADFASSELHLTTLQAPLLNTPENVHVQPAQILSPASLRTSERDETHSSGETHFSIRIEGHLGLAERNRLEDFFRRESLGIRPQDLKLQFEAGRIWLPRLSEYAVVLLVQQLRTASVDVQVRCSGGLESADEGEPTTALDYRAVGNSSYPEPEGQLPEILSGPPPAGKDYLNLGILSATAMIPIDGVTAQLAGPSASDAYSNAVLRIQLEIQKRAQSHGADCVTHFTLSWEALSPAEAGVLATSLKGKRYTRGAWKLTGTGSAQRAKQ